MSPTRPRLGRAAGSVASFFLAWLLLRFVPSPLSWIGALAAVSPAVAGALRGEHSGMGRAEAWLVIALASLASLWFRLSYLGTVPLIYNYEGLNFVAFADLLAREGFPYIPYAWYSHTLYSYVIAIMAPFAASELSAARLAAAFVSIVTVGTSYAATRSIFGYRAATLTAAMMSISLWHLYSSRNGYHHFMMPLLQSLLAWIVSEAARRRSLPLHALAGAALALSLHAYWGLYLLVPVSACYFLWRIFGGSEERGTALRGAAATLLTAALLSAPLFSELLEDPNALGYTSASLGWGWLGNLEEMLWQLSGNANAGQHAEHAPVLDSFTAAAFLLGLLTALAREKCPGTVFVLLLLAFDIVGLSLTSANFLFMAALIFPVYALAGNGLLALLASIREACATSGSFVLAAGIAVFCAVALENHERFFGHRLASLPLVSPFSEEGAGAIALPRMLRDLERMNVMVAENRPGHDFGVLIDRLGEYSRLGALRRIGRFDEALLPIPRWMLSEPGSDLALYLRAFEPLDARLIAEILRFYPSARTELIAPPKPYSARHAVTRIEIPWTDLAALHGPTDGQDLLSIPADGEATLVLDDGSVRTMGNVERGLRPFPEGLGCAGTLLRIQGQAIPLCDARVHLPGGMDGGAYMARTAAPTPFAYSLRKSIVPEIPEGRRLEVSYALYLPDADAVLVVAGPFLSLNSSNGAIDRYAPLSRQDVVGLERSGETAWVVFSDGSIETFDLRRIERLSTFNLGTRLLAADALPDGIVVLDETAGLHLLKNDGTRERLQLEEALRGTTSIAWSNGGAELLDTRSSEWISLDSGLAIRRRRKLGALYHGRSGIAADDRGLVFVDQWNSPLRVYDGLGRFVPHPVFVGRESDGPWRYSDLEPGAGWASVIESRQRGIRGPFESVILVFARATEMAVERQ